MMPYCFANGCRNGSERTDNSVTFHPFPAHVEVADRWASLCGVTGEQRTLLIQDVERGSSGKYVICSLHFEDGAFERDPASPEGGPRNDECRLRQGAEPTLFLSCPLERQDTGLEHKAQVPDPGAAPSVSAAEPGPSVSPRTPGTTVLNPQPGVSQIVLNFREQSHVLSLDNMPLESGTQCHGGCRSLQRVVKQIVLLFLDHSCELANQVSSSSSQDPPLILSSRTQTEGCRVPGVSHCPSSGPDAQDPLQPCPGPVETSGCSSHPDCPRRDEGLHHPRSHPHTHVPPRPCPGPVLTSHSSTQGDGSRRCVEVNYRSPNLELQISPELCLNTGRTDNSTTLSDGTDGQRQPVHSPNDSSTHKPSEPEKQTSLSRQEPAQTRSSSTQTEATRRRDDQNPLPPTSDTQVHPKSFQSSSTQTESPGQFPYDAGNGIRHRSCMETILTLDSWTQTQPTDGHVPRQLRKCETGPDSPPRAPLYNQPPCGSSCLASSLNQYVGNLLDRHKVSLQESVHHPCISPASSMQCPCTLPQPRVRQIVLNFLEQESKPATQDVPVPGTPSHLSSPALMTHQHQETQTGEELQPLGTPQEKTECRPRRPSKSHSCPPLSTGHVTSLGQQEENRHLTLISNELVSPLRGPQLSCDVLENKVTFDDVAVYFCKEEWELLGREERELYKEVMSDNYQSLVSLGFLLEKPKLMSRIEQEEEELWEDRTTGRRFSHQAEDNVCFADLGTDGVRFLENAETPSNTGRESVESSSHLGALMRLVNEIPGFLLGGSVTDGSSSPAHSLEDHENIRPCSVVKTEECSPACTPASVHAPRLLETPEIPASPGVPSNTEQSHSKVTVKVEEQVAVNHSSRHSAPISHPGILPICIKSDPGASTECVQGELQIKQEEVPADVGPAHRFTGQHRPILPMKIRTSHLPHGPETREPHTPDRGRRPCSRGGTSSWATLPPNRSMGTSPRNPSVSPASLSDRTNSAGLGDLKIKVKQEDSGSERDSAESPVCGRKVFNSPMSSPSVVRQPEREHWRLGSSPLRSPADNILLGTSPLHRLVNCLKEITAGRPRAHNTTFSSARWGPDVNRICTEASVRESNSLGPQGSEIPAAKPNPFTVAVTNGSSRLRSRETWTPESRRPSRDEMQQSSVTLSALGKCLDRSPARSSSGQNMGSGFQRSQDPRRPELGVKRTHSDDLSRLPGVMSGAKRPTLEASSSSRAVSSCSPGRHDVWRPPEEPQRPPSDDQPIGKSHLMSVMDCVRKIPSCRPNPSIRGPTGPEADLSRTCTQSTGTLGKRIEVKKEKGPSPTLPASNQWLQPPDGPDQPGSSAKNVHLSGLMRLMEEIPRVESSNSSRAMYSIAVGHSVAKRLDRSNYLSYCNDDGGFQAELNDNTIASVDSVFSDDTSWSSENVDPSYSAIGGLQRVVSEFAELGSISPLVAVSAPPASTSIQEGNGPKKPKEPVTTSISQLSGGVRRTAGDAPRSAASACSAENGAVAYAALCGLQKVVHGFVEQECVSPISAVRNNPPNTGQRDFSGRKQMYQEEEAESPRLQGFSPAPTSRFLCDSGNWMSETDSSYSALSGLQKVVNGFSEMSCVSPFSAVSTTASEPPAQDSSYSTPSGLKKDVNGVPEAGCMSPLTVASNLSSEGEPDPGVKRRCDRGDDNVTWKYSSDRQSQASNTASTHDDSGRSHDSYSSPQKTPGASSHCIDLTQEEEPLGGKSRTPTQEKQRRQMREGNRGASSQGQVSGRHFIDLTEEEELTKPKVLNSDSPQKPSLTDAKHRPCIDLTQAQRVSAEKSMEPGPSGPSRGGVPVVNEHLSGLEKLLKGVPTFTQTNNASAQAWSGSWWFKSTSSHET